MLNPSPGWTTLEVKDVAECKAKAQMLVNYMVDEGHAVDWGKSASFVCLDQKTGNELVKRTTLKAQ
jgi:hypothetical protein